MDRRLNGLFDIDIRLNHLTENSDMLRRLKELMLEKVTNNHFSGYDPVM